jgi:trehalose/maltose hydrolase-like predicted phosphorylase
MEAEIVPIPFPFRFCAKVDGDLIQAVNINRLEHNRCLDFQKGIYFEHNLLESGQGQKSRFSSFRFCSHSDSHLLIQRIKFTSENYSARIDLDLSLCPDEFAELYPHLQSVKGLDDSPNPRIADCQIFRTIGSKDFITLASRITVNGRELRSNQISAHISPGETWAIERWVSVFWSKDVKKSITSAVTHAKSLSLNLASDIDLHLKAWRRFWAISDLAFPQAAGPTDALRFSLYHLQSSAALAPQTSIPAKALTGRAYEGHIFWDTEIFIFPFFLYTAPEIARQLLLYRYNTLPGARKRASKMGFRGACYAWESTASGQDVTPSFVTISGKDSKIPIFTGPQELHITADVAWAISKYWDATLDQEFMCDYGVEILTETARFWVSRENQK